MSKHLAKIASISFWGKVVLYQLSYVRNYVKTPCQGRFHFLLGQGRALPTELRPRLFQNTLPRSLPFPFGARSCSTNWATSAIISKHLAKVASIAFWGKVVLYQLSYVRSEAFYFAIANVDMFRRFSKESMKFFQKNQ